MTSLVDRFIIKYGRLPTEIDPDYLEMLRMSKYRVLDVPDVSPGKCGNCGASKNDGRRYIDIGLQIEWYGAMYLCGSCLLDIANTMGLFKDLETKLEEAEAKFEAVKGLQEKGEELHETVMRTARDLEAFYAGIHPLGNNSSPDSTPSVVFDEAAAESRINENESRTSKQNSSSGRKDFRSLTELLDSDS